MAYTPIPPSANTGGGVSSLLVTNPGNTQNWDFATSISGDGLGVIIGFGEIIADASGREFQMQPNGAAPSTFEGLKYQDTAGSPITTSAASGLVIGDAWTGLICQFRFTFELKSGRNRLWICDSETINVGNGLVNRSVVTWRDTGTAVTSLRIHGPAANSVQAGSYIVWWSTGANA